MFFVINDKKVLGKYESIWNRVNNNTNFFNKHLAYNYKYLNTKLKPFNSKINNNFYPKKPFKKDSSCFRAVGIILESAHKIKN